MNRIKTKTGSTGRLAAIGACVTVAALAIPSIGLAFSTGFDSRPVSIDARGAIGSFTPASVDPRLASALEFRALRDGKKFRFTPAGTSGDGKRAMTIAVRVLPESGNAVNIKPTLAGDAGKGALPVQITQTAFSLGTAKGFQKFALPSIQRPESALPDLSEIGQGAGKDKDEKSRFTAKVELDENASPGLARGRTRAFDDQGGYSVDVSGSYSLSRNIDVTAGIRLKSDRDRFDSLTNEQVDSQAVFVGTQFRF